MSKYLFFFLTLLTLSLTEISAQIGEKKVYNIDFSDFNVKKPQDEEPEKKELSSNKEIKIANPLDFDRQLPSLSDTKNAGFVLKSNIDLNSLGKTKPRNRDVFGQKSDVVRYKVKTLPKQLKNIEPGAKLIFTDQNLGEIVTNSEYLDFYYRDHGNFVDGDIIKIFVDEAPFTSNIVLTRKKNTVRLQLKNGFTRLDMFSISDGTYYPNTVEWVIKDDQGKVVADNVLSVSKGFKGTIVVIKN